MSKNDPEKYPEGMERMWNEMKCLRQEVEFLKKIMKAENAGKRKRP